MTPLSSTSGVNDNAESWLGSVNYTAESWRSGVFGDVNFKYLGEFSAIYEKIWGCESGV
jgi:hypothetical protein